MNGKCLGIFQTPLEDIKSQIQEFQGTPNMTNGNTHTHTTRTLIVKTAIDHRQRKILQGPKEKRRTPFRGAMTRSTADGRRQTAE